VNINVTKELRKVARLLHAGLGILIVKDDIEFIYDLWEQNLQIGMGGEWWSGTVKPGKNVFVHRKERVDPAYVPVTVFVASERNNKIVFIVSGGFYGKVTKFELSIT